MTKGKILLIVFGLFFLMVVGAGTAFFFFFLQANPEGPSDQPGEIAHLGEFVVNVQHQRSLRIVRTEISLEMINDNPEEEFEKNRARIRDAIICVLRGAGEEAIEDPAASNIKEEIIEEVNYILGEVMVRNVFFTEFVVQ